MKLTLYARMQDYEKIRIELEKKLESENISYLFNGIGRTVERKPELLFLWQISSCKPYFSFTKEGREVYRTEKILELIEFVKMTVGQERGGETKK